MQVSSATRQSQSQAAPAPQSEPTAPDQPTHPRDPKWSGSSSESQDEEATKKLLLDLLSDTMRLLKSDFRRIGWQKSGLNVELVQTYYETVAT